MSDTATPPQSLLMDIPLELRYKVFEAVAARSNPPEHLFVHWFEKKEIAELIRNHVAANPGAPPPIARYSKYKPEPESESEDDNEDDDEDGDSEIDDEDSDQAAEDEDEDMDGEDDDVDDEDQVEPEDEDMDDAIDEQADQDDIHVPDVDNVQQAVQSQAAIASHVGQENAPHPESEIEEPAIPLDVTGEEQEHEGNGDAAVVSDNTTTEAAAAAIGATDATNATAGADTDATADVTIDTTTDTTVDTTATQPAQPPPPPPRPAVFKASPKWRHVAKFMKITHCPPPMELLLSSKVLNHEAMDWYYDAAILHIQATSGTIAHTSFFEEALNQIADAAFSPVENIRKVDVTFVWDSAWIHAQDNHEILEMILPALLHERARFILGILKRAPALKELVIHWHDSLQDNNSTDMKLEILESFLELPASVDVVEHFIEPDAKPYRKSFAGKFRIELQGVADRGFDAFYG